MKDTPTSRRPAAPSALLRTFIAVELDDEARRQLRTVQTALQALTPPNLVRWVDPINIHITLKFLGDTRPDQTAAVTAALRSIGPGPTLAPFQVMLAGRGCFPNFRRPHVIWVGVVDRGQRLQKLAAAVERQVAPLGWPTDARSFKPHLTLGRIADRATSQERSLIGAAVEQVEVGELCALAVSALNFIRSDLKPAGPVYTVLSEVRLGQ